jgi:hypothetical protein
VLQKTVELDKVLPHGASSPVILDFIEDNNMVFVSSDWDDLLNLRDVLTKEITSCTIPTQIYEQVAKQYDFAS